MEKEELTIKFWFTKQCSKLTTLSPWLIWALCTSSLCPLWKISLLSLSNSLNIWSFYLLVENSTHLLFLQSLVCVHLLASPSPFSELFHTHIWPCSPSCSSQNTRPYSSDFSPLLPFDESLSCIAIVISISTKIKGFKIGFGHKKDNFMNNFSTHAILLLWVEML